MIPLKRRLLKPLKYPEFMVPGMLCLMIGTVLAAAGWMIDGFVDLPMLSGLLVVTGTALLLRSELGSALMVLVLGLGLYHAYGRFEFSWSGMLRVLTGLIFLASMVQCLVDQIDFHRFRRKNPRLARI